ncbi:hypothetical protein TNCV_573741 [Trichonephila clavipes]|nr:hypothetical protein TNCV_573741 [Trichonephila clavipes]
MNFFIPELNNHDVRSCHTARATIDLLKDTFGDRLISRFGPVNWPPRSCDLTPLDYFLSGYVKSLVYADKPQTFDHLEDNIRHVIADIRPQMLEKVIENWTSRLDYIRASHGIDLQITELFLHQKKFSLQKGGVVVNVGPTPFHYVGDQKRMVLLPKEVGEKGFLESRSPTFRIDSSRKDIRRTGFEGPDWRQKA